MTVYGSNYVSEQEIRGQGKHDARDALKKINVDPESVLITVNGKLVTDDFVLREGQEVKLVTVISGGQVHPQKASDEQERRNLFD